MTDPPSPPADGPGDDDLAGRVGRLEAGQETLVGKLDQVLGMLGGGGDPPADPGTSDAGHPATVRAEIRAQLEERDRKVKADQDQASRDGTLQALQAQVAALTETAPAAPPRRSTRLMWGRD